MRGHRTIIAAVAVALALVAPAGAVAAEAPPLVEGETDVQLWPGAQPGQLIVIVSVKVPEGTQLPARVRIPAPEGMGLDWAGEIIPEGDPAEDPEREVEFGTGTGGQYAEMELSESGQGQAEFSGIALGIDGSRVSTGMRYTQTTPTTLVAFSVRLPAGVSEVSIDPAPARTPERNAAGEVLYTLPSAELEPGEVLPLTVSYTLGAAAPQQGAGSTSTGTIIGWLLGVIAAALVVLVVMIQRQRRAS